jgi:hypothetical protein
MDAITKVVNDAIAQVIDEGKVEDFTSGKTGGEAYDKAVRIAKNLKRSDITTRDVATGKAGEKVYDAIHGPDKLDFKEKVAKMAGKASSKAGEAADAAKEKAGEVAAKAGEAADAAKEKAGEVAAKIGAKAGEAGEAAKSLGAKALKAVSENPGIAAVAAAALAAGAGAVALRKKLAKAKK